MNTQSSSEERPRTAPFAVLSIGALSRATGVPVETLRTWERRYGFPSPVDREEAGHRRYPLDTVERLRLVVRALEAGHKPGLVIRASQASLEQLLAISRGGRPASPTGEPPPRGRGGDERAAFLERAMRHVLQLDGDALALELEHQWNELGALGFLTERLGPFLSALGEGWSDETLEVGHEHLASERVREFLSRHWRQMSDSATGPAVVCGTLSGELHVLGIHMAATALALAGLRVVFLGASTPPEDVAHAAVQSRASAIALSAAAGASPRTLQRDLLALRRALPEALPILAGGAGFTAEIDGVQHLGDLHELHRWARDLAARSQG